MRSVPVRLSLFATTIGVVLTACRVQTTSEPAPSLATSVPLSPVAPTQVPAAPTVPAVPASPPAWLEIPLTDVRTGVTFKLSDFTGQVIILEAMAVWCPLCAEQQNEVRVALKQLGDKVVAVSVDVDPGEDAATLAAYVESRGFSWPFTVAPAELSQALVSDFGPSILSAPATPLIIIDPAGIPRKTPGGIKKAPTLVDLVNEASP